MAISTIAAKEINSIRNANFRSCGVSTVIRLNFLQGKKENTVKAVPVGAELAHLPSGMHKTGAIAGVMAARSLGAPHRAPELQSRVYRASASAASGVTPPFSC